MDKQEEKHIAPLLHKSGKLDFQAPEGYFDDLSDRVLEKAKIQPIFSETSSQRSTGLIYWAAAAGIAVLIGFMIFTKNGTLDEGAFIAGYSSVDDYLISEDEGELMEAYVEYMPAEEESIEMDYLMETDEEWIEDLYIEEI